METTKTAATQTDAAKNKRQGLFTVSAVIAIQLTVGIAYIWSVFQNGVAQRLFEGDNAKTGLTFSILLSTLTVGSVIGGKLAAKFGTKIVVLAGGVILSAGFFLAALVQPEFSWALWLTYGLMGGVGMGFTYSTTIACAQKWYPHKKGLVTGVVVSALGLGGVVFTPVVERLVETFGGIAVGEGKTFMVLAAVFLVTCTVGSFFMKNPPEGYMMDKVAVAGVNSAGVAKDFTSAQMLKSGKFYLIVATFMLACMGGLMMIGFAKPIAIAKGMADTAVYGVLAISMFNSLGRLLWGMISDKLGRYNTLLILLGGGAVLPLFVNFAEDMMVYVLIAVIGFFYGGLLSTFPSLTADIFGAKHLATNYGFVLLGFGVGAVVSSFIAGHYKNLADVGNDISLMSPAFVIAAACAAAGFAMILVLKGLWKKDRG